MSNDVLYSGKITNVPSRADSTPQSAPTEQPQGKSRRRTFILGSTVSAMIAALSGAAIAAKPPSSSATHDGDLLKSVREQLERGAIAELIVRERAARDAGQWAEMASCYHPDSSIEVSWFKGHGAAFVELSKKYASATRVSLHQLSPSVVTVNNDRAIAETPAQLTAFVPVDGIDVCIMAQVRLLWRAQMLGDRWLLAGLRVIYIRDMLTPVNPSRVPAINEAEAIRYRASYRSLSYAMARTDHPVRDDLPGVDRPETVTALRVGEAAWLEGPSKTAG